MDNIAETYEAIATEYKDADPKLFWPYFEAGKTPGSTRIAPEFLPLVTGPVLDLGSASGTKQLKELGIDSIHVDINKQELKFGKANEEGSSEFVAADAEQLPFKDNAFTTTLMLGLLGGVGQEQRDQILDEALRVTKNGGHIYTAQFKRIENDPDWDAVYERDAKYLPERGSIFIGWETGKVKFIDHHFTPNELRQLLEGHGLNDINVQELIVKSEVGGRQYNTLCAWGTKGEETTPNQSA